MSAVMHLSSLTFCRDIHIVQGTVFYKHTFLVYYVPPAKGRDILILVWIQLALGWH